MSVKKFLFLLIPTLLFVLACDRIVNNNLEDELVRLEAWLQVNHITPDVITPSGLYFVNKQEGTGVFPSDSDFVVYSFTTRNLDGDVYETSYKNIALLNDKYSATTHYVPNFLQFLNASTKTNGLSEGISMMKEGGKAKLILPSALNGTGTTIIYDIELIKVVSDPVTFEKDTLLKYLTLHPGFLSSNNDSIYYKKTSTGTRTCVVAKDSVVHVKYTGRFLDGFVFDTNVESVAKENNIYNSSKDYKSNLTFTVGTTSNISGFSLAVKKMIEGEKATFIMPSKVAYGITGNSVSSTKILPYTTLVFEIELVKVDPAGTTK